MSTVITTDNESLTPSDNRIVFKILSDDGVGVTISPEGNNFLGLALENVSGNYSTGVWDVVNPVPDMPFEFIKLPNVGTELILDLFELAGVDPPEDLPDNLDRYTPNNLVLEFTGGTAANLSGEFVSADDTDYVWDVNIDFDTPVNWATWSGAGNTYAEVIQDFPLNRLVFNDGQAVLFTETELEIWIGEAPTDYTNDGTTITFSNTGYTIQEVVAPNLGSVLYFLQNNLIEGYVRCGAVNMNFTFSDFTSLEKIHFLSPDFNNYTGTALFDNNDSLEEILFLGWDGSAAVDTMFESSSTNLTSLTTLYLPNASDVPGADDDWLDPIDFSTLQLYINTANQTNNGGGVQQAVADAISGGATVTYNDWKVYPDGLTLAGENLIWTYWEIDNSTSTLTGKTGSPLEGITLTIDAPLDDHAEMQVNGINAGLTVGDEGDSVGMNFTITGATAGSILFGANSYSFETDVYINNTLHSTHRLYGSAGEVIKFDVSGITRSVVGKPVVDSVIDYSCQTSGLVYIKVRRLVDGTQVGDEVQSQTITFWKARLNELDFFNWTPSEWVASTNGNKFLTNYPRDEQRLIGRTGNFYLSFFYPGFPLNVLDTLKFRRKRANNEDGTGASATTVEILLIGNIKTWNVLSVNLLSEDWSGQPIGTYDYMFAQMYNDTESEVVGEELTFAHFEGDCAHGATVHFMNKLGVMESYYFNRRKIDKAKVKGFGVEVNTGEFAPTENGEFDYLRRAVDSITLVTEWISESVQNWLVEEVIESPYILIEIGGFQFRANVAESRWTKKTLINDNLFDQEVKFELAEIRYSPLV